MRKIVLLWLLAVTAGPLSGINIVQAAKPLDPAKFSQMASTLADGLTGKTRRVAVRPFTRDELPVAVATGELINDALTAALQKRLSPKGHQLVARNELLKVFAEAEEFHAVEFQKALDAAKADVLMIGKVTRAPQGGLYVSYRANDVLTGRILSSTRPIRLDYDVSNDLDVNAARNLEAALENLAQDFADALDHVTVLRPKGLYYADSGIQTRFGDYTSELLLDRLAQATGARKGNTIALTGAKRKLTLETGEVDTQLVSEKAGDFLVKGTYWDQGKYVELRVVLKNAAGRRLRKSALILKSSIGEALTLQPDEDLLSLEQPDFAGPLGLYLSSDRGNNPVYQLGDAMNLLVQVSEDAHLYCFYHAVDKSVVKLFPNSFQENARLAGGFLHRIPGQTMPFKLRLTGPAGVERIHCFATDRDVNSYLPLQIRANDFEELPDNIIKQINRSFRAVPDIRISEATMMVTLD